MTTTEPIFEHPFPALTPSQRLFLEVSGYVIVPDVLSRDECETLRQALQSIRRDLQTPRERASNEPFALLNEPHHVFMGGILESEPCITAYATHPRIVGLAEELIGGEARLVEFNAHINKRVPNATLSDEPTYDLHMGTDVPFGSHIKNGLYHCNFVKTLTMLTDVGPDDGGTVVIAGSHKLDLSQAEIIAGAYADRSLIHRVTALAGSTLLFSETLIHATGQIRSDRERAIIIGGYGASMFPYWDGAAPGEAFQAQVPERFRNLLLGRTHWERSPRYRTLAEPADSRKFTLQDGWWPEKNQLS